MRHIKLLVASVILMSVAACVADKQSDLEMLGYIKTINIVGPDEITFEQKGGVGQTKATSVNNGSALVFNWAVGDTLGIFPNKGNQVEFPITAQEGSTSASFDGGGWALRNNASYAAYYPFSVWNYFRNNKTVVMDYSGQVQNGNGSFAHLSAYDFLASVKTTPKNSSVTFQMDRQGSILYIDIVVPEPATITSLTISCNEAIFVEKAALDISGNNPVVTPIETKESLTLNFVNTATTEQNETVRAYMAVQPLDFSSKTVTATLVTDAGTYTAPVVSRVVNKGKAAFLRFSDSFTDGSTETTTPPNNEIWYTSTDGNIVEPAVTTGFGANIVSNTYENGKGVIRFDGPVTAIGGSAFGNYKCKTLATIEIPTSVTTIGGSAFTACEYLSWPDIPASVTKIGRSAFFGCDGFVDVVIPNTVTEFGESIFQACENLRSITSAYSSADKRCLIVDGVLNSFAFAGLGDTYIFPDNITSIGNSALRNNQYSGNLVIGDNVTRIEIEAFAYMSYIKSIQIGNNVSYIGSSAFRCFGYKPRVELELPASLTSVGVDVFTCYLSKLTIHAVVPPTSWGAILSDDDSLNPVEPYPIYVPAQSVEAYKTDQYWGAYADRIQAIPNAQPNNEIWYTSTDGNIVVPYKPESINVGIISNTYEGGKGRIVFDGAVTSIGNNAFSAFNAKNLKSIVFPATLTSIGDGAFSYNSNLENIQLNEGLLTIGSSAFECDRALDSIYIPSSVTFVNGSAFMECTNLQKFSGNFATLEGRLLVINGSACGVAQKDLTQIELPQGITEISTALFQWCYNLTSVTLPSTLQRIGSHAFYDCYRLKSISPLPESLQEIGGGAFAGCSKLEGFTGKFATQDGRFLIVENHLAAFAPNGLKTADIPEGVETIDRQSMSDFSSLETVHIPSSVKSIALYAFSGCNNLNSITVDASSVPSGDYGMFNQTNDCPIYVPFSSVDAYKSALYWSSYAERIQAIPDNTMPEAVDLGLPSGLKWATCNVGANAPEEYGDYFAWGATEPNYSNQDPLTWEGVKTGYNWVSYKFRTSGDWATVKLSKYCTYSSCGIVDNKTVLYPEDDAAHVNWSGTWRMPTFEEWKELKTECTWTWITQNGINGCLVTGPNGNNIFLPAAGQWYNSSQPLYIYPSGSRGYYWSSSLCTDYPTDALCFYFDLGNVEGFGPERFPGHSVRAVSDEGVRISMTGVTLNKNSLSLSEGGAASITATVTPWNATQPAVIWSSSNTSVATVDYKGKVTAVAAGTATITAKTYDGGYTATCSVTVMSYGGGNEGTSEEAWN